MDLDWILIILENIWLVPATISALLFSLAFFMGASDEDRNSKGAIDRDYFEYVESERKRRERQRNKKKQITQYKK